MVTITTYRSHGSPSSEYSGGNILIWVSGLASSDQCLSSVALPMLHLPHFALQHEIPHLVGGWTNPSEKYAQVKLDQFPRDRGENKKYLSCHHLVILDLRVGSMLGKSEPKEKMLPNGGWNHGDESHGRIRKKSPTKQLEGETPKL